MPPPPRSASPLPDMLPRFNLTADVGSIATQVALLGGSGAGMWLAAGNIAQTLFAGGTLLHRKRAAEAGAGPGGAQSIAPPCSTPSRTWSTCCAHCNTTPMRRCAIRRGTIAAAESLDIARTALKLGSVSYLSLLNAEQAYQQALIGLAQAQGNRYADTAALFQALGGGWWNRPGSEEPFGARGDH